MNNKPIRRFLRYALSASLLLVLIAGAVTVHAAFPGTNGKIAFDSDRDGNEEVYVMNADGSGQTNLSNNPAFDAYPAWSPDGTKIAFFSNRDGNYEIYVMNADGSGQTNLTNNPGQDYTSSWSPDGTKIAFTSTRDGNPEIYVMNADGTSQTRLTYNSAYDDGAVWSPDGTKIAFSTDRDGGCCPTPQHHEIYVMNADGSGQTNITNNSVNDGSPDWSPDGTKIAFNTTRDGNHEIYVMNADGSSQTRLTNEPTNDGQPAWSPDGTKIAYAGYRDDPNNQDVYVMNADGTGPTRFTNNPAFDYIPDWQPLSTPAPITAIFYLHGSGATANPPILFLNSVTPTSATAKYKDSASVKFSGGNTWQEIGVWAGLPGLTVGQLTSLSDLHVWLGLKNSDDIGTRFDLRAEVYRNGVVVTAGESDCITAVTRNPDQAKEVVMPFGTFAPVNFDGSADNLSLKIMVWIGTNGAGAFCGGHSNAVGARLYFDSVSRAAKFGAP